MQNVPVVLMLIDTDDICRPRVRQGIVWARAIAPGRGIQVFKYPESIGRCG